VSAKIKAASGGALAPTAAEQAVKAGRPEFSAVDATGRVITLRKPTTWEKFELPRRLGGDSVNPGWLFQARMIQHVKQIGEDTDVFFTNDRELKAIVDSLGEEGMETVEELYVTHFMKTGEDTRAEIKK